MKLMVTHSTLKSALAQYRSSQSLQTGRIIRRLRELSGISQGELAHSATANLSYISTMESGMNNTSIRIIMLFCNALNLSPADLFAMQLRIGLAAGLGEEMMVRPKPD
jgi:transcriptional regulator with XRE-family HTH domain